MPSLGHKYICANCGCKFYDMGKKKAVCPKCGNAQEEAARVENKKPDLKYLSSEPPISDSETAHDGVFKIYEEEEKEGDFTGTEFSDDLKVDINMEDEMVSLDEIEEETIDEEEPSS